MQSLIDLHTPDAYVDPIILYVLIAHNARDAYFTIVIYYVILIFYNYNISRFIFKNLMNFV